MDDAAADRKCEYVALLSSGSIVIGSHCLLPFGNETPSVGVAFPRPFARLWWAAAAYILVCRRRVHARCDADQGRPNACHWIAIYGAKDDGS
jgi:hypothetical protein